MKKNGRLIIVSNRLPVTIRKKGRNYQFSPSVGGLATSLGSFYQDHKDFQKVVWLGWPGSIAREGREEIKKKLIRRYDCYPVYIPESLVEKYYEGFSNGTLWPLFHSFQAYARYELLEWGAYKKANGLFCEEVIKIFRPDDTIWVHDYHLMLLPKYLREKLPGASIGFFLHIPFPTYDIFRLLPQSREIIEGILGSDLVGFHTYDYAQSFLLGARRLLGLENDLGRVVVGRQVSLVDVFPIGIDFAKFSAAAAEKEKQREIAKLEKRFGSAEIIFSVSRLDYTKGLPQSLEAVEEFFGRNPNWREKVTYILVVVPSREGVERYAALKREVDELVGRVNSKFGTLDWLPIRYIYRKLTFDELIALYSCADIALNTPLRDGMNLIAKEYIAAKSDKGGVLILSEMAGAAKELLEALIVNPNNKDEIVQALGKALAMSDTEKIERNKIMRQRLRTHNIERWAERFLRKLGETVSLSNMLSIRTLKPKRKERLVKDYAKSKKRLIILDYDGTLASFVGKPEEARPDTSLLELLKKFSSSAKNKLVLISGRDRKSLHNWFGGLKLTMVAEHGAWVRNENSSRWVSTVKIGEDWKKQARPMIQLFVDRIPESFIEEKDFSLCWHYRRANVEIGSEAAKELTDTLTNLTANLDVSVLPGSKAVEIKGSGISKGAYYSRYLAKKNYPFILAIGDDRTDESLFSSLPKESHSIRVGFTPSAARFNLGSSSDVLALLDELSQYS